MAAGPVIAPCGYSKIKYVADYASNRNDAFFDGLYLHKELFGRSYTYDNDHNLISTQSQSGLQDEATYDSYHNLTSYKLPGRDGTTTISYGDNSDQKKKRLPRKVTSPIGTETSYSYTTKGNQTQTQVKSGSATMKTAQSWDTAENYVTQATDAAGVTTVTQTDPNLGTVSSTQAGTQSAVSNTHDVMKRVTKTEAQVNSQAVKSEYAYTTDRLTEVRHNTDSDPDHDVVYTLGFDLVGRPTTTVIGGATIFTQSYGTDGTLEAQTFANGGQVRYGYDSYKRMIGSATEQDSAWRYVYTYGANGELARLTDNNLGRVIYSEYDLTGRPMRKTTEGSDGTPLYTGEVAYDDEHGLLASFSERMGTESGKHKTEFTYDQINRCTGVSFTAPGETQSTHGVSTTLDGFSRMTSKAVNNGNHTLTTTFTYAAGANGGTTSARVTGIQQLDSAHALTYTYTDAGLIASVTIGTDTVAYTYDSIGQLIRVDDPTDTTAGSAGTTWKYTYDWGGNILTKKAYVYGTTTEVQSVSWLFYYGNANWKDQLTVYSKGNSNWAITYDAVGNPLTDGTWTYTWQAGRQLKQMTKAGETVGFEYNDEGLRVRKTASSTGVTEYTLHGKQVVHLKNIAPDNTVIELHFYYGSDGKPAFVKCGANWYAYVYNLQGDVVALTDASGAVVVEYSYDAWGASLGVTGSLATTLGMLQPFRYRGYVWDEETGLYYLRSRYYRAEICRFVNEGKAICGNVFEYCNNLPVLYEDQSGDFALLCACIFIGMDVIRAYFCLVNLHSLPLT